MVINDIHEVCYEMSRSNKHIQSYSLSSMITHMHSTFHTKAVIAQMPNGEKSTRKGEQTMFVSEEMKAREVDLHKEKFITENTDKATQWAVKVFMDWSLARQEATEENPPKDILLTDDKKMLCDWLCNFFLEVRKSDGMPYGPRSLASILSGIHRYIQQKSPHKIQIQRQEEFEPLHTLLENLYRKLHNQGIGTTKNQASVISLHEEEQLWASETLSSGTSQGLTNAVFYYNGINFCLRGGEEHRNLKETQLCFGSESDSGIVVEFVEYTEHGSKNRPGGKKQLNLENKTVRQYAQSSSRERCHVYLLKLYLSKLPPSDQERSAFYYKPLTKYTPTGPWYSTAPLGHNTLKCMLKAIFTCAGLDYTNKSNHSLRAMSISRMYEASVPEKIIMERSGHLSKDGV